MQTSVAVTGGSGFIGSQLCAALAEDPRIAEIFVIDRDAPSIRSAKIRYIKADLRQPLETFADVRISTCYHLAAACREPGFEWGEYFSNNHLGTREVCAWADRTGIDNIVFTSTAMVFRAGDARHVESDLPDPDTAYGISKALAEETLIGWRRARPGRRLRIVRPGVVFGAGAGGNFVNLHRALRRGFFCYVGRRDTVKSAIYVKDLVRLLLTLETDTGGHEIFHGAYAQPTTIESVCEALCSVYGWRRWIPVVPFGLALAAALPFQAANALGLNNPIHTRRIEKLFHSTHLGADRLREIGFVPRYDIRAAIADWRDACVPRELY